MVVREARHRHFFKSEHILQFTFRAPFCPSHRVDPSCYTRCLARTHRVSADLLGLARAHQAQAHPAYRAYRRTPEPSLVAPHLLAPRARIPSLSGQLTLHGGQRLHRARFPIRSLLPADRSRRTTTESSSFAATSSLRARPRPRHFVAGSRRREKPSSPSSNAPPSISRTAR